ncbi:hypothetical protein TcBrA4_0036580 [Trypanosoma cruzi]|nr:hypothetical protein TcBrA4_0036580 [Trypanosoma cruzi]
MYGMLCALGAAFAWLLLATALTLPVSSTHSIAGGIIGFSLVYGGANSVSWAKKKSEFPFVTGVVPIIASWFISPLLTGLAAATVYGLIRTLVLRPANSVQRALYSVPVIFCVAFFLESFFVLFKGAKSRLHWPVEKALWVAAIIGVGARRCLDRPYSPAEAPCEIDGGEGRAPGGGIGLPVPLSWARG